MVQSLELFVILAGIFVALIAAIFRPQDLHTKRAKRLERLYDTGALAAFLATTALILTGLVQQNWVGWMSRLALAVVAFFAAAVILIVVVWVQEILIPKMRPLKRTKNKEKVRW